MRPAGSEDLLITAPTWEYPGFVEVEHFWTIDLFLTLYEREGYIGELERLARSSRRFYSAWIVARSIITAVERDD